MFPVAELLNPLKFAPLNSKRVCPIDAFEDIAMPPFSLAAPVISEVVFVESPTVKTPDKFALDANVFHLKTLVPKSKPEVPGVKADVPELSLNVAITNVPIPLEAGEKPEE